MLRHEVNLVGIHGGSIMRLRHPAQGLTLFLKERASGKFELPKKQTEEEDAADAEEAAARDSEEQAAECARPSLVSAKRSAASCLGLGALLMSAHICLCEVVYRATPCTNAVLCASCRVTKHTSLCSVDKQYARVPYDMQRGRVRHLVGWPDMSQRSCADDEAEGLVDGDGDLVEALEPEDAAREEEEVETKDEL